MNITISRMRMFAGPNGSGKSTIKSVIDPEQLGVYINPDDIEKEIRHSGYLDFASYDVETTAAEVLPFFQKSPLLVGAGLADEAGKLRFSEGKLDFISVVVDAYFASVAADFIRQRLLKNRVSFTFETTMSHPNKIELLRQAHERGFRTYLYFVATEDPQINISRVENRVRAGGHPVPENKIIERYHRSLNLLADAVQYTDRAFIFDNSSKEKLWVAEITAGKDVEMKTDTIPHWFKLALSDKILPCPTGKTIPHRSRPRADASKKSL